MFPMKVLVTLADQKLGACIAKPGGGTRMRIYPCEFLYNITAPPMTVPVGSQIRVC